MTGQEIDLMEHYPKTKRDVHNRGAEKTPEDREIARRFDKDFFDGDRKNGYGGFNYHPRFWQPVVPTFQKRYDLDSSSSLLDVGCAKGFMLYDFQELIPGITIRGVDISEYAVQNSKEEVRKFLSAADARELPFEDKSFDLVISITTLHNLPKEELAIALKEVERVKRKHSFITLDAYRNNAEKERMEKWNLTAKTMMHVDEWKEFFDKVGYTGDYFWFIP